jgi:hypothetical protein
MMAAAKRTSTFFTQVPGAAGGSSSSSAAAAAAGGGEGVGGYRLYTKEEFEAANKTQVSQDTPLGTAELLDSNQSCIRICMCICVEFEAVNIMQVSQGAPFGFYQLGCHCTHDAPALDCAYALPLAACEMWPCCCCCCHQAPAGKRYFSHSRLADIIGHYPFKQGASDSGEEHERQQREALLDLLIGVLDLDPKTRWTPRQAIKHPFITGEPFTGPYQPAADSPPQGIHHYHHHHHHHHRHHSSQQQQGAAEQQQQQQFAAAVAAAASQEQLPGSFGAAGVGAGSFPNLGQQQQQQGRAVPVAMASRSYAHQQQQQQQQFGSHQQQYAAAAAAGMLQATPPSGFLGPGSFPGNAGSFVPGSTSNLLQYSPAAAQVHARAHAIAMAALQQLSPQLGSSFRAQTAAALLGTSVSNRGGGSGSYNASAGEADCLECCNDCRHVWNAVLALLCSCSLMQLLHASSGEAVQWSIKSEMLWTCCKQPLR